MNAHTANFHGGLVVSADYQPLNAKHHIKIQARHRDAEPHDKPHDTDRRLLARIACGDKLAMQSLYARHHLGVYRFVRRLLGDTAAVEDVVSEVFLAVWRHAGQFEGRSQVSSWLLAIARFSAISNARRQRRDQVLDEAADIPDGADNPEAAMQKSDRVTVMRGCLNHLSQDHRAIIDLVYYHDKSIDEVARIIGIPKNTVKTRMFYARKRMRGLLAEAGFD